MSKISQIISELLDYASDESLIKDLDRAYCANRLLGIYGKNEFEYVRPMEKRPLEEILADACHIAYEMGLIEGESPDFTDPFDTKLMGELTPMPSTVIDSFYGLYKENPTLATDYFYHISTSSNYIRLDRIKKDLKWSVGSEYGDVDLSINLSKPEKDPKAIALARSKPQSDYPRCALCHENEGYFGTLTKPARQTLRQIPFDMAGEKWYLQYSPYVYYNEHCIALSEEHKPMAINRSTFSKLLNFVTSFPHYFIGSNADLPIVGGSILSHDHMQGGRYTFAMERAKTLCEINFTGYADVDAQIIKWPLSVIRLNCNDKDRLVEHADKILGCWREYTDEDSFILAYTDGEPHNTITPIARRRGDGYELDLTLRNNITTEEHPLGVYHPHAEHHNIKKENIGLIEVMGLAVLPSRLKSELDIMCEAILQGKDFSEIES